MQTSLPSDVRIETGIRKCYLPDFSERGNSVARKSWMRPEKIVFCDLDSLRTMSANKPNLLGSNIGSNFARR